MRLLLGAAAIAALTCVFGHATAQPAIDPLPADRGSYGGTKIPVTMPGEGEVLAAEAAATSSTAATISIDEPVDPDKYSCGPGDTFEINFWGQQNFRLRIAADLEGRVFISKVGFVTVTGKTLTAVRKEAQKKIRGTYPGLNFELTLVAPRSFLVHVVENVSKPGLYTSHALERVSVVIARAGGLKERVGSKRRITIRHRNGTVQTADLTSYELNGDTRLNPYVLDGDVITVPATELSVTISGAVRRPGTYELVKSKDLAELIDLAGGFEGKAARTLPIRIIRNDEKSRATYVDVPFGDGTPNAPLRDLDSIEVRSTDELQRTVLLIGAVVGAEALDTATSSKRLPFVEGDTVRSLLERAGGVRAPGDLRRSYISRAREGKAPELIALDLEALLVRRDFSADKPVTMNDTIVIPPMQYSVLVEGAVARAGLYPYNPQFGVPEYIAHAGGRTRTARDLDEAVLIDWNGNTHPYKRNMKLSPGDAILVPERNFTRPEIVQIVIAGAGLVLSGVAVALAATR